MAKTEQNAPEAAPAQPAGSVQAQPAGSVQAPAQDPEPAQPAEPEARARARVRSPLHLEAPAYPVSLEPGTRPRLTRLVPRLPDVEPLLNLASRPAADVGEIPADLVERCRAWRRLPPAQRDARTAADAAAFVEAWAQGRMTPGDYGGRDVETIAPGELVACGQADGVVYLGEVQGPATASSGNAAQVIAPSLQRYAIRYVRRPDLVLQALHGATRGLVSHDFNDLCRYCRGIREIRADVEAEREARYGGTVWVYMSLWKRAIDAVQPEHAQRWIARKAEAGVWCLFYV